MVNIKMTVNITLPGRVMLGESVCQSDRNLYNHHTVMVQDYKEREVLHVFTRGCAPATQTINVSEESYKYMVSADTPYFAKKSDWGKMSKKQRLIAHLKELAASLGGELKSWQVYPD